VHGVATKQANKLKLSLSSNARANARFYFAIITICFQTIHIFNLTNHAFDLPVSLLAAV